MPNEICILCGTVTNVDINTHVDFRTGYIEGAGQLCIECYQKGNQSGREMITIPKHFIKTYSNDFELGEKVRQYYYSEYSDREPQIENQWICKYCGEDTSGVDYDYLSGTDHISCILDKEMKA
jgi:hypothetical protein